MLDGVSLIGMLRSFFVCDPVILRLSAGRLSASRRHRRWQCRRWMPRHRHANAPVGSGQNGMARTMGLLSRPAGRLPPPRRLQARLAALLLREQFVELLLVGVVVEEVVQPLARLQAVDDVLLRAIAAHGFVEAERGLVHRPVRAAAVERDVDARFAQLVGGEKRGRSEEHTSELQSLMRISYAVFCLKKTKKKTSHTSNTHIPYSNNTST